MIGVPSGGTARLESWILITLLSLLGLFLFSRRAVVFFLPYSQIYKQDKYVYLWGTGIRECSFEKWHMDENRPKQRKMSWVFAARERNPPQSHLRGGRLLLRGGKTKCLCFFPTAVVAAAPGAISLCWNHDWACSRMWMSCSRAPSLPPLLPTSLSADRLAHRAAC